MKSAHNTHQPAFGLWQQFVESGARNRRLVRKLKHVTMTYLTHRGLLIGLGVGLVIVFVPQMLIAISGKGPPPVGFGPSSSMIALPLIFLPILLVAQAKAQFAHARSRLVPGFAMPHLATLAGVLMLIAMVYPLFVAWLGATDALGTLALAVSIVAPVTLGIHFNRFGTLIIAMTAFFSTMTQVGSAWWLSPPASNAPIHAAIIVGGSAALVGWLWRLGRLREEADDYQTTMQWRASRRTDSETTESRRIVAEQMRRQKLAAWISDIWLARIGPYHGGHAFGRARLLRFGFGQPGWVQGLMMGTMFYLLTIFLAKFGYLSGNLGQPHNDLGPLQFFMVMSAVFPGMLAGETLAHRRPTMGGELLRPLTRSQYADGLLTATVWNSATMWAVFNSGIILLIWQLVDVHFTATTVGMVLLLSATVSFASGSVSLRTAVWPSQLKRMGALWLTLVLVMPPLVAWQPLRPKIGEWPFVGFALLLICVGIWMLGRARRAWMNLELG